MAKADYQPDKLLGHADENDGIEEYDNKLPTWWLWLFYVTIVLGIWIFLDWHVFNSKSLAGLYEDQMKAAEEKFGSSVVEADLHIVLDDASIEAGRQIFQTNCVSCHAEDATGNIGPNLTDHEWIYGGTPEEIGHTVFYGTPNGMVAWGQILGNEGVSQAAAFVHSLGGGVPRPDQDLSETEGEPGDMAQDTEAPAQPETEAPAQPETEVPAQPETEAPAQPETEVPAQPETEVPAQPETEVPAEAGAQAPVEAEPEAQPPAETEGDEPAVTIEPDEGSDERGDPSSAAEPDSAEQ